jgi:hypothetical protein
MQIHKVVAGSVLAAGLGVAGLFGAGAASADVSTNGTDNDAYGYGIANHIANFNGDHDGIGWIRSEQTGAEISSVAGTNRVGDLNGVRSSQGNYAPISNGDAMKNGNKVTPVVH